MHHEMPFMRVHMRAMRERGNTFSDLNQRTACFPIGKYGKIRNTGYDVGAYVHVFCI